MSMLFPKDFIWKDTIVNGVLLKGPLGKKALGRSHGSIIHRLYNDYGPDRTCRFINELQRINHIGSILHKTETLSQAAWSEYIMSIQGAILIAFLVDGIIGFSQNDYKEVPALPVTDDDDV